MYMYPLKFEHMILQKKTVKFIQLIRQAIPKLKQSHGRVSEITLVR